MRSLPPGAMGPSPHRSPHRHDVEKVESPRRIRKAVRALARSTVALVRRVRPAATVPAAAPAPVTAAVLAPTDT